ncbi:hypothetical protein OSB04_019025 [Centaurea solstitialis]|uniref:Uncharacterized protein n=1 Tax=Centaurea solstitialis TaxID=347529 RepID=A0AA38W4N1_9ASTR|nr:hypothetical protein OSB04_019025 [Centaurea solstitialis]
MSVTSSEEKVSVYDLWLLEQLTTDDTYLNAPYNIVVQLAKGGGYREGSRLVGGQYITLLAKHFGILTEGAIASMTNLGEMGLIDMDQLRGMGIARVEHMTGRDYNAWIHNPQAYGTRSQPRDQARSTHETGGANAGEQPAEWTAYAGYQDLSNRLLEISLSYGRHHQHVEYNTAEALHQANWQSGVMNQMASHFGIQPNTALKLVSLFIYNNYRIKPDVVTAGKASPSRGARCGSGEGADLRGRLSELHHSDSWGVLQYQLDTYFHEWSRCDSGCRLDVPKPRHSRHREAVSSHPEFKWGELIVYGEGRKKQLAFCSVAKAGRYLRHGCAGYLAYAVTSSAEERKMSVADVPVVSEYPDVFPEDLPGIPPEREVEFGIDLVPETAPVARTPYRLAPPELQELSNQLQDSRRRGSSVPVVRRGVPRSCS